MFLVLGWLAQHRKGWVVLATGTALFASGIGIFVAGFTSHQPLISRVGVLIVLVAVIFAVLAVGARRSRTRKNPDGAALGELGKRCIRCYAICRWAKRPPSVRKSAERTRLPVRRKHGRVGTGGHVFMVAWLSSAGRRSRSGRLVVLVTTVLLGAGVAALAVPQQADSV